MRALVGHAFFKVYPLRIGDNKKSAEQWDISKSPSFSLHMFVTFPIVRGWGICVWTCTEKIWEDVKRSSTSKLEVCYTSPVRPSVCQRLCAQLAWGKGIYENWSTSKHGVLRMETYLTCNRQTKTSIIPWPPKKKRNHDCPRHVRQQELTSSCYHKVIWSNLITCFPNPSTLAGGSWRGLGF